jgi:vitamin B12 transporter
MAAAFGCAHAQNIQTLEPVVVTASGFEQSLANVIPSISVITREEIDRSGALSLADLVMGEPGIEVGRNGGLGTVTSFFLRGAESKNVLVLVDGVRMRDGVTQSALAENIPLGLIEQVEIIRGNVSAIYGDAAVGGVISIKTRRGDGKPQVFVASSIGERNTRDLVAGYSGSTDGLRFSLTAQHTKTDGFSAIDVNKIAAGTSNDADRDPYENNALGIRISQTLGDLEVGGGVLATRASLKFDNAYSSAGRVSDPAQEASNDLINVYVQRVFSKDWTTRLDLSRNRIALRYNYDTTNPTTVLNDYRLSNTLRLDPRQSLRFGLDRREETRSPADNSLASRNFTSPYIGYLLSAGRWSGQLNARYDSASVGESKGTWLVGAGYQLSNELRATASASTAFRFPDSYALSTNASLRPESHESREVGLVYETSRISLRTTLFVSETDDPITYNSLFTLARNANFMKNKGLELYGALLLSAQTKVKVGLVVQDPESPFNTSSTTTTRVQSARRAKVHGSIGVTHTLGSTELAATLQGASRRRDTDSDTVGVYKLPGYATLNLRGQVRVSKELSLNARLDNALDKQYELAYGYNTAPRTVFIGLQFQPSQ